MIESSLPDMRTYQPAMQEAAQLLPLPEVAPGGTEWWVGTAAVSTEATVVDVPVDQPNPEANTDRFGELLAKINQLPDTTSREVVLDPARPDTITTLGDLQNNGKGWKMHLNFDTNDSQKATTITGVLERLKAAGAITDSKVGNGGGTQTDGYEDAPGKEATIYVGSKDKTDLIADYLSAELQGQLTTPTGDALRDDIELAPAVMGRFEVYGADPEFMQYSGVDTPVLKDYAANVQFGTTDAQKAENLTKAQEASKAHLQEKYGAYYTGSQLVATSTN